MLAHTARLTHLNKRQKIKITWQDKETKRSTRTQLNSMGRTGPFAETKSQDKIRIKKK